MATASNILLGEKDLLSRISAGDESAFTELFYHYSKQVWSFVVKKTRSETIAEEVVQEIFIKLWQQKEKVTEIENFRSFVFKMAVNKTVDHLRKISNDAKLLQKLWQSAEAEKKHSLDADDYLDYKQSNEQLKKAIDQLPPERKKIYLLNTEEGLSYDQIATKLNISKSTVDNQLWQAKKFIRQYLKGSTGAYLLFIIIQSQFLK